MQSQAQAVIIGGGVVGASVLYHLTKLGWKDVLLVEKGILTCGSTWHAAGGMHTINSDPNVARLQTYTIDLYKEIEEISGHSLGLHMTGGIMLASSDSRVDFLRQMQARSKVLGQNLEFVDMDYVEKILPIADVSHFKAALYDPLQGHLDPVGVTTAYAKAAKKSGAEIIEGNRVLGIKRHKSGNWEVQTQKGNILTKHVVNAGGLWAREVGRMTGLELPIQAMAHQYLITEDIDIVKNHTENWVTHAVDFDAECYLRQEINGILLGTYEPNGKPWMPQKAPWDFESQLLPDDLEQIAENLEQAFVHYPALSKAGIKQVVNGPFVFGPDGNPLIGPVPGQEGLWLAVGVMAGFSQGGGVGLTLSQWMVNGTPSLDIWAMDNARYGPWASRTWARKKVIENYGRRFRILYPNEELPSARPHRTTAIYDRLKAKGAVFGAAAGLEYALWFTDKPGVLETPSYRRSNAHNFVAHEVTAVRENVGLCEIASFAKYRVSGTGAAAWLNSLMAGRIPKAGRMALSPMLSYNGKLLGDFSIANYGTYFRIIGSGAAEMMHLRWFWQHLPKDGSVILEAETMDLHGFHLAGPNARIVLQKLSDCDLSNSAFRFFSCLTMDVGNVSLDVARVSFSGELGYELYVPATFQLAIYEALLNAGASYGIHHFGARALNSMRLEKGFGSWTRDYTSDYSPLEAGLDEIIIMDKGDFIGKKAYEDFKSRPQTRRLMLFEIDTVDADAEANYPIFSGDTLLGYTTSGSFGHKIQKSLALGYVHPEKLAANHNNLSIEILGQRCPAHLVKKDGIWDPKGARMRS